MQRIWNYDEKFFIRIVPEKGMAVFVKNRPANSNGDSDICSLQDREMEENALWIDGIRLDSLVKELKISRLDFIKMDIEGMEIEALKGADDTIMKFAPRFAIASYHMRDQKQTFLQVEHILGGKGYSVRTFFDPHLTTCARKNS